MNILSRFYKKVKYKILHFFKKSAKLSKGEAFVKAWLDFNNITYQPQFCVEVPQDIRPSGKCYIDFMVRKKGKRYAIEYNGRQHYEFTPFFHRNHTHFEAQLRRDEFIKRWCEDNNVNFIEIPYYMSSKSIEDILGRIL